MSILKRLALGGTEEKPQVLPVSTRQFKAEDEIERFRQLTGQMDSVRKTRDASATEVEDARWSGFARG